MLPAMRIVFFGTPDWAVPSLERLVSTEGLFVAGVVTAPDRPVGRSKTPRPTPLKLAARDLGIAPVLQPETLRPASARAEILDLEPDVLAVVAYGKILPGRMLDAPPFGAVNVHFSLLPRHRGASPVQHTILHGEAEAGVTTMRMERGLDTGPILLQESTPVGPGETASQLGARLARIGAPLLARTLVELWAGTLESRPQDHERATEAPLLQREMGWVRWRERAEQTWRKVRAFDPWPPVVARSSRGVLRLLAVEPVAAPVSGTPAPGTVLGRDGDALVVACGEATALRLQQVQPAGRKPMPGAALLAGRWVEEGETLGDGRAP